MMHPSCPSCRSNNTSLMSEMPLLFVSHDQNGAGVLRSGFYKCSACYLFFRWPRPTKGQSTVIYTAHNVHYLTDARRDWIIARNIMEQFSAKQRVLDVGCFEGDFLALLGPQWERFGIELNTHAALKAAEKGVLIVGENFDALKNLEERFEVVTAFDVIEHADDPTLLLTYMLNAVVPGGLVIIATGTTSALSWRLMKGQYWYCAFPGHISFINEQWIYRTARELGVSLLTMKRFSHGDRARAVSVWIDGLKNIAYTLSPRLFGVLRAIGLGGIDLKQNPELRYYPPNWRSAKDHLLVVFQKPK